MRSWGAGGLGGWVVQRQQQLEAADRSLPKSGQGGGGGGSGHKQDGRDGHHEHQGLEGGIVEYLGRGRRGWD